VNGRLAVPNIPLRTRDNLLIIVSLGGTVGLAWGYLFYLAQHMTATDMPAMAMSAVPAMRMWNTTDFVLMFLMWSVMMVGMMVPTAMRALLIYGSIASRANAQGTSVASTIWFASGYVTMWTMFSLLATFMQYALERWGLLSPMMVSASVTLGATLLVVAGIYQLTPWKDVCLKHCQSPAIYLATRFKPGITDAVGLGARHGAYCLGCCWAIMVLLFLGGVMNLLWVAAITAFVLAEKLLPAQFQIARVSGVAMIIGGVAFLTFA
jgi:predicted metal-binding membrane protein